MRGWSDRWNSLTRTKVLGWKTSDEALEWAYVRALAWLGCIANGRAALHKLTEDGDAFMPVPKPRRTARRKRRRKRLTSVDRYLA